MSNTPGMGAGEASTDNGADDAFDLNDVIGNAFDEASATGGEADAALASAEQTAAVQAAGDKPQTPPTEAAPQQPNPSEWTANDDAALAALPPEAKALVDRRIASIEAGFKDKVTLADEVSAVVDPDFQRKLSESGMSIGQGVQYLANLERFASTQPAQYLAFVASEVQKRGVDVAKALGFAPQAPQQGADQADPFNDPRVAELQQQLGHLTTHIQTDSRQRALDTAGQQIAAFRDAKGADGNSLRPHFAEVENDMARLLGADRSMTLEAAYEAAVWSNPAVRAKLQEADRTAAIEKARKDAAAAQKAAKGNVRSGGRGMEASPTIKTSDDAARAAMESLGI